MYGLGNDSVEAEDANIEYPDTLEIYIIVSSTGAKSSRKIQFSVKANGWRRWADNLTNTKTRCIAILVRVLVINSLEEVFGSQVILAILRQLSFQRICLAVLKKTGGEDQRHTNNGNMKYDIRLPSNAKEATQFDGENGKSLWSNNILK